MGTSSLLIREKLAWKMVTKRRITDHFIVGDIDSILIEGTINVSNFCRRGKGMVFGHGNTEYRH